MKQTTSPGRVRAGLLLAAALACPACGGAGADGPLSVLLVTLDTTRPDALGCYGGKSGATPVLDALAAEGVLYERAYTVAPLTLPAHASMMTGLYPLRHTVRDNGMWALPRAAETLAESAREAGLQTAAFVSAVVLARNFGLDQGFETYDAPVAPPGQRSSHYTSRDAGTTIDAAIEWLENRARERRFFLWVHLFDPHAPYEPPPAFQARFPSDPYVAEVAAMDAEIGRLLAALEGPGSRDEALVVFVADHGEGLGEHMEETHGAFCFDSTMRVPFIVRYPDGHRRGARSDEIVSVVDVHPTLAAAMGLTLAGDGEGVDGIDLFRRSAPAGRGVHFESYYGYFAFGWSPLAGWVDERYKYVHSSEPAFYDLEQDPGENENVFAELADRVTPYRRAIEDVAARSTLERDRDAQVDDALLADIRSLGYAASADVAGLVPHPLAASERPGPLSMVDEMARTNDAQQAMNAGNYARAEELLRAIVEANPGNLRSVNLLGLCLAYQGRRTEAIPLFRRVVAEGPPRADACVSLGLCLLSTGAVEEARALYLRALELDPEHRLALSNLAALLESTGRAAQAREYRERLEALGGR